MALSAESYTQGSVKQVSRVGQAIEVDVCGFAQHQALNSCAHVRHIGGAMRSRIPEGRKVYRELGSDGRRFRRLRLLFMRG